MIVTKTIHELQSVLEKYWTEKAMIGFVPTMGALHKGHFSLMECSKLECSVTVVSIFVLECSVTVVSIFVNPTQFNNSDDYIKYPRLFKQDIEQLQKNQLCDIVFMPDEKEMYPVPDERMFDLGYLEQIMEGKYRPGHFQGVAKIVSKLFDIVKPNKAYFGKKDFQQLAVIKKLVKDLNYPIEIVGCEIVREPHGLAMSSRNLRLSTTDFQNAKIIYETLQQTPLWLKNYDVENVKKLVKKHIEEIKPFLVEYVEIVDNESLLPVEEPKLHKIINCCVAVFCNDVRLIDNLEIKL